MKYIVKNCPANLGDCCAKLVDCECNTDCLLKRIVERCKSYEDIQSCYDCNYGGGLAYEILQMFKIEEVE